MFERDQMNFTKFNDMLFLSLFNQPPNGSYQRLNVAHIMNFFLKNQLTTLIKTSGIFTSYQVIKVETLKLSINRNFF